MNPIADPACAAGTRISDRRSPPPVSVATSGAWGTCTTSRAGVYKGYSATTVDWVLSGRYKVGKWAGSAALLHLGAASTDNPSDRGAANSATVATFGVYYEALRGLQLYSLANLVNYGREGLSSMSMPSNSAFTNIDSRLTKHGNWFTAGIDYRF